MVCIMKRFFIVLLQAVVVGFVVGSIHWFTHWVWDINNLKDKEGDMSVKEVSKEKPVVTCFCPECGEESFTVTVEDSGSGHNYEFGQTVHWFGGEGKCSECGHASYYADGSL